MAHDGEPWLVRTLEALRAQTRPPDVVVAVDTGSRDGSLRLLRDALGEDRVLQAPRDTGFGAAVAAGLEHAGRMVVDARDGVDPTSGWVWLLHDDSAAEPRVLELLLDAGSSSASVGAVGPKLVAWDDSDLLLEAGLTVGRAGRRATGLDGIERDQGQHDHRSDVLAVGSAGMLVRRDVWDELGGFDPALPLLRDDIDFCWRAQLAGHRVVLAARARVADAQAATRGRRSVDAVAGAVRTVDRQHGQHVALARCSWPALPFLLCSLVAIALTRAALLLAAKAPGRALEEMRALALTLFAPWRWLGSRLRSRGRRRVPRASLAPLLTPRFAVVRHAVDVLSGWAARDHVDGADPESADAETGPVADEAQPVVLASARWPRRVARHPLTWVAALLVVATGFAWRDLITSVFSPGSLVGGELRTPAASAGDIWLSGLGAVRGPGLGSEQLASPGALLHAGWVALVSLLAGDAAPQVSVILLLATAPLLAGLAAYLAAGVATRSRWLRAWGALVWGAAPLLTSAIAQGRIGPVAVAVVLPLVAAGMARALTRRASGALTATFAASLALAAVTSAVPVLGLVGAAVALLGVGLCRGSARLRALLLLVLPVGLLGPWVGEIVREPRILLAGPGAVADAAPATAVSGLLGGAGTWLGDALAGLHVPQAWVDLIALHDGWPVLTCLLWLVPLGLLGLAALGRGGRRGWVVAALGLLGALGLALAAAAPFVTLSRAVDPHLTAWAGSGALIALLAVVAAPVVAADGVQARLARHGFGWRQMLLAPLVLLAICSPMVAVAGWAWAGVGPDGHDRVAGLRHTSGVGLPAVAADAAAGPLGTRTLVLAAVDGQLRYQLDGGEPGPVARDLPPGPRAADAAANGLADQAIRAVVGRLASPGVAPQSADVVPALQRFAVGFLLVRDPVPEDVASRLDATAGLARIGRSADGQMWRVGDGGAAHAARAQIESARGKELSAVPVSGPHATIDTIVAKGPSGRVLVLAEVPSDLRRAELDGKPLALAKADGAPDWRQVYVLPARGGHLTVAAVDPVADTWRLAQLALAALVALLALPVRRPNGELR